jgi:hypothetical protein
MLSKFWKLTKSDWVFIVLFDLTVFYIGYSIGKKQEELATIIVV